MLEVAAPDEPLSTRDTLELVAFQISPTELNSWRGRLNAAGITIEAATEYTLYLRDPDGRRVGLSSYRFE